MSVPPDRSLSPMVPADDVPPGYPKEAERWVRLTDGSKMFVRPIVPEDEARMARAMEVGDGETIRRRFLSSAPPNHPRQIRYLVEVDYRTRFALLAMDGQGDSIGIARYEGTAGDAGDSAEVAIVVAPDRRRRGVASFLLRALEPQAIASGITEFVALYHPENRPVAALLTRLGYGEPTLVDGLMRTSKTLR